MMEQGVVYPRSPGNERHVYLAMATTTDRRRVEKLDKRSLSSPANRLEKFRSEFKAEMEALPDAVRLVVISAEQFSMMLQDRQGVQNLHDMLAPHFDEITVVAYLRRPDQHFASLYSEMLRWGDVQMPDILNAEIPPAHGYDYDGLLDRWASVFGETAIKPQIYERLPGQTFDIVTHFASLCGLTLTQLSPKDGPNANSAFSFSAQMMLVELGKRVGGSRKGAVYSRVWQHLTQAALAAMPGASWKPTRQEAATFVERFADNHEAVRRRWFAERASLFSTDFSDLPEEPLTIDSADMHDAYLRMILQMGNKVTLFEDQLAKEKIANPETLANETRLRNQLAKRIDLAPDNVEARVQLARLLFKQGDQQAARNLLRAALKIDPRNAEARALRAEFEAYKAPPPEPIELREEAALV